VIEWITTLVSADSRALRYQIKLNERSGVIEYHYCALPPTSAQRGAEATIGLQDTSAARGQLYLHNGTDNGSVSGAPRSVGGGSAASPSLLRYTPR
jgi:hypothetical protein